MRENKKKRHKKEVVPHGERVKAEIVRIFGKRTFDKIGTPDFIVSEKRDTSSQNSSALPVRKVLREQY